ncbi:MAG: OpgC domain-containing protein [Deltaproteobacteria bacterium]
MRITIFDGLRGFFLVFMTINHLNAILHTMIGRVTPGALGFVENAHGFVLMSGLVVGLVYGKRLLRQGAEALDDAILARMRTIWTWHVLLVLLFMASSIAFATAAPSVLVGYSADAIGLPLASLLLVSGSEHMGILPMYLWFMLVTPVVLRAFARGEMRFVIAVSAALWLFAQSGAGQELATRAEIWFAAHGYTSGFGLFFNVFGWQAVFFAGLAIGWLLAEGRLSLDWLTGRVAMVALVAFVALFALDRLVNDGFLNAEWQAKLAPFVHRGNFGLVHLVSTVVDAILLTWLIAKGGNSPLYVIRRSQSAIQRLLNFPPLVRLGQHSLQIFAAHLPLVYLVRSLHEAGTLPTWSGSLIIVASPFYLYAIALLHEAAKRPRRVQTAA